MKGATAIRRTWTRMTSDRIGRISIMQQHNVLLAILCQHLDIKASIFLSFVAVMLFAYAFNNIGSPYIFVLALAFAVAYPMRIGVKMLADKPVKLGGADLTVHDIGSMKSDAEYHVHSYREQAYKGAIRHNTIVLKKKHRENKNLIITSMLLFGYIMTMTAVVKFMELPNAGILSFT